MSNAVSLFSDYPPSQTMHMAPPLSPLDAPYAYARHPCFSTTFNVLIKLTHVLAHRINVSIAPTRVRRILISRHFHLSSLSCIILGTCTQGVSYLRTNQTFLTFFFFLSTVFSSLSFTYLTWWSTSYSPAPIQFSPFKSRLIIAEGFLHCTELFSSTSYC